MRVFSLTGLIILAGLLQNVSSSLISTQIAYQGILTDGAGNPFNDTTYNLVFTLHTDSVVATGIWTESKAVTTKGGMFSHMLGSVKAFDTLSFSRQYWLSIKRGGDQIGQRIKLGVVPYARRAIVADSAGKIDGKNIIANSIDSSKISNGAVTTNEILNGTIKSEDVSTDFKAPFTAIADLAKTIEPTAIKDGMIGTAQISSIQGNKIIPTFGNQSISGNDITTGSSTISDFVPQSVYDSTYYPMVNIQSGASGVNNIAMRMIKGEPYPDNGYGAIQLDFLKKGSAWPVRYALHGLFKDYVSHDWQTFFTLDRWGNIYTRGKVEVGAGNGIILVSPNGTKYQIKVNDDGTLNTSIP